MQIPDWRGHNGTRELIRTLPLLCTGDCIRISGLYSHHVISVNISKANPDIDKICEQQEYETEVVLTAAYSFGFFHKSDEKKVSKYFLWYIMQSVC